MTLTADSKGRIACRDLFPPHASFEALKEPDGRVTLIRLRREDRRPRLVKPVVRKGLLVLPLDNGELDSEALDREIRDERERENARLLVWHSLAERTSRPVCAGTPGRRTAFNAVTRQWP